MADYNIFKKKQERNKMSRRKNPKKDRDQAEKLPSPQIEVEKVEKIKTRGRTLIAVDLANLYCQMKSVHADNGRIGPIGGDYSELKNYLVNPNDDCTPICFAPISNPGEDRDSYVRTHNLHNMLRYYGYMVYTTERRNGKADVDVQLVVKSMEIFHRGKYDCFILVSADGDFEPLLVSMRECGARVAVASVQQYMSVKLKMNADEIIDLHEWSAKVPESETNHKEKDASIALASSALEEVNASFYEAGKIFEDKARRRLVMMTAISTMGKLMNAYGMCKLMVHRGIVGSMKDCLESIGADGLTCDDLSFVCSILEILRSGSVSLGMNNDIRTRFANRGTPEET